MVFRPVLHVSDLSRSFNELLWNAASPTCLAEGGSSYCCHMFWARVVSRFKGPGSFAAQLYVTMSLHAARPGSGTEAFSSSVSVISRTVRGIVAGFGCLNSGSNVCGVLVVHHCHDAALHRATYGNNLSHGPVFGLWVTRCEFLGSGPSPLILLFCSGPGYRCSAAVWQGASLNTFYSGSKISMSSCQRAILLIFKCCEQSICYLL